MSNAPQFSLRWNNYVSHVTDAFNLLRLENDLVDVTLCCDGGKIKAHKMVLSVCSNYFREIFKENPCQHPVIIFKNVKYEDLNAIVYFMYHGEVNIFQEQLESFLVTAELLEVKGLTDNTEDDSPRNHKLINDGESLDLSSKTKLIDDITSLSTEEPINLATMQPIREDNIPQPIQPKVYPSEEFEVIETPVFQSDSQTDDSGSPGKSKVRILQSEDMQIDGQTTATDDTADKNTLESDMALKFRCHICPKGFKHPTSLTLHKDSHAGKTQCPVCHRSFSRSYDMRSHLQRIHQGKQFTIKEIRYKNSSEPVTSKQFMHHM